MKGMEITLTNSITDVNFDQQIQEIRKNGSIIPIKVKLYRQEAFQCLKR